MNKYYDLEYHKKYKIKHKEKICKYQKEYRHKNANKIKEYQKKYRESNKERISGCTKKWYKKNKDKVLYYLKDYNKKRKFDPSYRLIQSLRARLRHVLKGRSKPESTIKLIGCTTLQLRLHLESLFKEGMSWDNYGCKPDNWSIDHIIPLSSVDLSNPEELSKVSHYTNLQPLWHIDNIRKGNKLSQEELNK